MKKAVTVMAVLIMISVLCGCAEKTKSALDIKNESVTSIEFKKTCYSESEPDSRSYVAKTVTVREDIDSIISWVESLKLTKQSAIEIPVEQVDYVIVLNGTKQHNLIFVGNYVVFDTAAYTFDSPVQQEQVKEKYNLLNYEESSVELDLM